MNIGKSQVLNISDGGIQKISGGHMVGIIMFDIVTGEGKPEKLVGYCRPNHRDAIIKNLKRLSFKNLTETIPKGHQESEYPPPEVAPTSEHLPATLALTHSESGSADV